MEYRNRKFIYACSCGYTVNVFIDFGSPQENYRCRKCGSSIRRQEV